MESIELENIKKEVIREIQKYIDKDADSVIHFNIVKKALKPFIGKPLSKRLATAVQKAYGDDYITYWQTGYGQRYIEVKHKKESWDQNRRYFLGYDTTESYQEGDSKVPHSGFNYYSGSMGDFAEERIEKNKKILANGKAIDAIVMSIYHARMSEKLWDENVPGSYDFPALYRVEKLKGGEK